MELHRDDRNDRKLAGIAAGYGVVALIVGSLFALLGERVTFVSLVLWISGGFFLLIGVYLFVGSLRGFRLVLDHTGLIVHTGTCDFEGSWNDVDGLSVEEVVLPNTRDSVLVLFLPDRVPTRRRPRFPGANGRKGHRVISLDDLVETPEQVRMSLEQYAGPKFRSPART